MAASSTHRGWLRNQDRGLLAAVYNGVQPGTRLLGANTALDGILLGTPVTPALAVDSMVLSNLVANGDFLVAANNGGNSQAWLGIDASAGTMTLYGAGTALSILSSTVFEIEDGIILALGNDQDQALVNRATTLASATALTGVIVGTTPVTDAMPANTLIISNVTASGDIVLCANNGGTSSEYIRLDASLVRLVINDPGGELDVVVEGDNNTGMIVVDGGLDALGLGRPVVTGAFASLSGSTVNRNGVTAVGRHLHIPAATLTQNNAAVLAIGAGVYLGIPTFADATGASTITDAATLYIAGDAAAGTNMTLTRAYALWVDAGTTALDGRTIIGGNLAAPIHDINIATLVAFNEQGSDIDFRVEGDNNVTMLIVDAGTDSVSLGKSTTLGAFFNISWAETNRSLVTSIGAALHIDAAAITDQAGAGTLAIAALLYVGIPTLNVTGARTYTAAATLYLAGAPAAGTNATITSAYSLWIDAGDLRLDGNLRMTGADDLITAAGVSAALQITDGTGNFYTLDTRLGTASAITHRFDSRNFAMASGASAVATSLYLAGHTLDYNSGTTQVTSAVETVSFAARALTSTGGALTVDEARSLELVAPTEDTNVTLTRAIALHISNAAGTPTNQYGIYIASLSGGTTANRGIYLAGANSIQFAAADDLILVANTAAALEITNGTTAYLTIDTRTGATGIGTYKVESAAFGYASGATAVHNYLIITPGTLTYTGTTQVTSAFQVIEISGLTITDTSALTVDQANTMHIVAPIEGGNVTLTAASAIRIANCGGTPTNQYGIYIDDLTSGATSDVGIYIAGADTVAIWVASADPLRLGVAAASTGLLEIAGGTSGVASITAAASTTSYTLTLPAAANADAGYQLTCAGTNTITSWGAAGSLREIKDILGEHSAADALDKILGVKVYDFHYKPGKGTQDSDTAYVGVVADEAPWAMHYQGGVVNPVNSLGYTILAFQAMAERIRLLEGKLAALGA